MKEVPMKIWYKFLLASFIFFLIAIGYLILNWNNAKADENISINPNPIIDQQPIIDVIEVKDPIYDATINTTKIQEPQEIKTIKNKKEEYINSQRFFRIITPTENYETQIYNFIKNNCIQIDNGSIICGSFTIKTLYQEIKK